MMRLLPALFIFLGACSTSAPQDPTSGGLPDATSAPDVATVGDLEVLVTAPESGAVFGEGAPIQVTLNVSSSDGVASPLTLRWSSDRDGDLLTEDAAGSPAVTTLSGLSPGAHILEVSVTDAAERQGAASLVVVVNRAPTGSTVVTVIPEEPTTSQSLEAVITTNAEDPEGDLVTYTYTWAVDEITVDEVTGPSVPSVLTARGQTWSVTVTPSDGISQGLPATATTEILNTPPSLSSAQVLPSAGGTGTPFSCTGLGYEDPDGDPEDLTFQWTVNEIPVDPATGPDITGEHYVKGDSLVCTITPSDPYGAGEPVQSAPIPIVDTPSTVETVLLEPTEGDVTTTFACSGQGLSDLDAEDEPFLKILWVINGQPLPGTSSATFNAGGLTKGDTVMCRLIPATVEVDGPPLDSPVVTLGNAPPVSGSVVMEPPVPTEITGVTCVPAEPTDPDGDNVAYSYEWTVDGLVVEGQTGNTLSGEHFNKGQVVSCAAIPFDGEEAGEPVSTKFTLTIGNSPPSLETVTISPDEGSKTDTFTCAAVGWTDPDPVDIATYIWEWRLNGEVIPGGIFQTLDPAGLAPGELTCTVTPGDGADVGAAVTSAPALLVNHPPSITGVTLGPEPATEASTLTCDPSGWEDQDDDPPDYIFAWSVQGQVLDGVDGQTLTGEHFEKGHLVLCIVTPTDGSEEGGAHTSNPIQIGNSPPSLSGAEVTPPTGGKGTTFTCQVSGHEDADQGDAELVTYTWLIGDEPIEGAIESTVVPGDSGYHGAQLRCQATPFDGTDYGEPVLSGTATLINGAPMVSGVTIVPQAPTALDALSCVANLAIDPEGDTITFGVVWTRNQSPLPEETDELLGADQHQEGDVIRCQLTPDDGELTGPGVWSEEVVIGPAPALDPPEVTLLPTNPSPGEALFCDVAEPDGDVTYTWLLEGEEVQEATEDTLNGALVEACESWTCRATVTGPDGVSPPGEDTVTVGPATGEGDIVWHGHHGYTLGGAPPVGVSQWYQNEKVATLLELPDEIFPLTITHVRFYGAVGSGYNVRVYDTQGILPADALDGGLGGASAVGIGGLTTVELDEPVTFFEPQDFYLSLQGQTDLQPLYGDGDGQTATNMAKACVLLCLFGPPSWQELASLGSPFSSMGDIILDAGTATGADGDDTCP